MVQLYSSLGKKVCTQDDIVFDVVVVKTTSWDLRRPARVLTNLASPSNFVIMPFGKADLLIIETFEPESKST